MNLQPQSRRPENSGGFGSSAVCRANCSASAPARKEGFVLRLICLPSFVTQVLILWQQTQSMRTLQVMPNGRPWNKPEAYPLPASSSSGDHPVGCHECRVVTVLLGNGLFLAGSRHIFCVKRRGCIRTTHGNVSLKRAKAGCHQREPSPY